MGKTVITKTDPRFFNGRLRQGGKVQSSGLGLQAAEAGAARDIKRVLKKL
ncbi:MAG: hypothetical protein BroJett003_21650 [Planctomycetota bacterium]|nr:MAG: hypothetical protein BroJett003_21650 [Planctomycetota bacterium]